MNFIELLYNAHENYRYENYGLLTTYLLHSENVQPKPQTHGDID